MITEILRNFQTLIDSPIKKEYYDSRDSRAVNTEREG